MSYLLLFLPAYSPIICFLFGGTFKRKLSLLFSVLIWLFIAYVILCAIFDLNEKAESFHRLRTASYIYIPLMFLIILWETIVSSEMEYLTNIGDVISVQQFLQNLRTAVPTITFHGKY